MSRFAVSLGLLCAFGAGVLFPLSARCDDPVPAAKPDELTISTTAEGKPLDPRGVPKQDLTKVDSSRFYIWFAENGWRIRSASIARRRFTGSIKVVNGTFSAVKPIGLETKSGYDRWEVSPDKTELKFKFRSNKSFDGFNFNIQEKDALLVFDLTFGDNDATITAERIHIGPNGLHPASKGTLVLPADVKKFDPPRGEKP